MVIDNWFTGPLLVSKLIELGTYVLGTVQSRRKFMPKGEKMNKKLEKGGIEIFSNGSILIERYTNIFLHNVQFYIFLIKYFSWMDRRNVLMINSFMSHNMEECVTNNPKNQRFKPSSVLVYNSKMGGVDSVDQIIKPYESIRKSYKWYQKVYFHLMDIGIYNSFRLFNHIREEKVN